MRNIEGRWIKESDLDKKASMADSEALTMMEAQFREDHLKHHARMQEFVRTLSKTNMG